MYKTISQKAFNGMQRTIDEIKEHSSKIEDVQLLTLAETLDAQFQRFASDFIDLIAEGRIPELTSKEK